MRGRPVGQMRLARKGDAIPQLARTGLTRGSAACLNTGVHTAWQRRELARPDRLAITSLGGPFGGVTESELMSEPVSSSRNAHLAKLLEDVEVPARSAPSVRTEGRDSSRSRQACDALECGRRRSAVA